MMITMDFNKMTVDELDVLSRALNVGFVIENGVIIGTEKIPTQPTKAQ